MGKYDRNSVKVSESIARPALDRYRRASQNRPESLPVNKKSLVYIQPSPDYCTEDPVAGVVGTTGRRCSAESRGRDGCDFLCCGRGFKTQTVVEYKSADASLSGVARFDANSAEDVATATLA